MPLPRLARLPEAVPVLAGLALIAAALARAAVPNMGWGAAPMLTVASVMMLPFQLVGGYLLIRGGNLRRLGAMLGAAAMAGGAVVLVRAGLAGLDVHGSGWFGPVALPWAPQFAVVIVLLALCALTFLREDTRLTDDRFHPDIF